MDYKPVPVGVDNFEHLVTRGYYFIDKTWFMKELLDKKGSVNFIYPPAPLWQDAEYEYAAIFL